MQKRFVQLDRILAVALVGAFAFCEWSQAAEPAVSAESYQPILRQPANASTVRVAQITPAQGTAPAGGAQPGQSTIPSPSSTPTTAPPAQGAQPGQSTIPPASSSPGGAAQPFGTPGAMPVITPGGIAQPGIGQAPINQPGISSPAIQRPGTVVVPRVEAVPPGQVVVPPTQVVVPPQVVVPQGEEVLPSQEYTGETITPEPFFEEPGEDTPFVDDPQYGGRQRRGVRPYGGGHPWDWSWGCGGSPYRTNGMCDDWKVGCRWHVTVDGMVMSRQEADLDALAEEMEDNHLGAEDLEDPTFEQFDRGPGGRIMFMSQVGRCTGWDVQIAYEGIEAWNSSIVFEKEDFEPEFFTSVITTETLTDTDTVTETETETTTTTTTVTDPSPPDPNNNTVTITTTTNTETETETNTLTETETTTETSYALGPIPIQPGDPFPEGFEQRSLHYRSNYHSGEMNFLTGKGAWRPYAGFRFIQFDDEINDFTNQEAQPPLPFEGPDNVSPGEFLAVATTDRLNLFDIENNLMGFQVGLYHDTWNVNRRFAIEGFVNGGVYYNKIKYTNLMGIFTTQVIADDTSTVVFNEARTDFSDVINNDVREYSEIAYHAEASLTGVCRLNKCWALRGGYQVLWIDNVHVAEDAYLGDENVNRDLLFHGWHAGIECRR